MKTVHRFLELNSVMESEHEKSETPNFKRPLKKKCENAKRFTDEQVKLLESMFKLGTKIEPREKLQLARDLGLQPRQVAIWFQNKRARWKSKQLEHEYRILQSKFDHLNTQFESLKIEKERLLIEVTFSLSLFASDILRWFILTSFARK